MRNPVQLGLLLLALTAIGVFGYNVYLRETTPPQRAYTEFLAELRQGTIAKVHFRGQDTHRRRQCQPALRHLCSGCGGPGAPAPGKRGGHYR